MIRNELSSLLSNLQWAKEHDEDGRDIGIDLVATIRDEGGYAAIQCKCYDASHIIKKKILIALSLPLVRKYSPVVFWLIVPKAIGVIMLTTLVMVKRFVFNRLICLILI